MSIATMLGKIAQDNGEEFVEMYPFANKAELAVNKTAFTILSAEKRMTKENGELWFIIIELENEQKQTITFRPNPRRDQLLELVPQFAPVRNIVLNRVKLPNGNSFYALADK